MPTIPQTSYSVFAPPALAGQAVRKDDVASYIASENIAPGVFLEVSATGSVRAVQTLGTGSLNIAGVALLKTSAANGQPLSVTTTYLTGDVVPVLRRGRVWCSFTSAAGATGSTGGTANILHPSTTGATGVALRGFLTSNAATGGTGIESQSVAGIQVDHSVMSSTTAGLILVDVNFPQ